MPLTTAAGRSRRRMLRKLTDASILVPAASAPHVEGFHLVLTHLVSARLEDAIGNKSKRY